MSGLYLHIPYCKQVCYYCDFHFRASFHDKDLMLAAMEKELFLQKQFLGGERINTLYFGGGTPSVLSFSELERLMNSVREHFDVAPGAECTLEANPDDLSEAYLRELLHLGFNRLSIGVQSFDDHVLRWMNRRHSGGEARECVHKARAVGFDNISIDVIYGIPGMTLNAWKQTLLEALLLQVQHISAYHLTIEPRTVFGVRQKRGARFDVSEQDSVDQFGLLRSILLGAGWDHYEISNFSLPGFASRHNCGYWQQKKYLGIGPSAHSYNQRSRSWNVAGNRQYIEKVSSGGGWYECEELSNTDHYNDYIMTSLRTSTGVSLQYIEERFGTEICQNVLRGLRGYVEEGYVGVKDLNQYVLTEKGMFVADRIASDLFET